MPNTSKIISRFIGLTLVSFTLSLIANETTNPSRIESAHHTKTTKLDSKRVVSTLHVNGHRALTLRYDYKSRKLTLDADGKQIVLEKISKRFDPRLVGAERYIQLFPINLQL
jgi:hypothetical protein